MGNPGKGEVTFAVKDGRQFTAVFDMDFVVAVEDAFDKPIGMISVQIAMGRVGYVRAALWRALQVHHKGLTMADVSALMLDIVDEKAGDIVQQGIQRAFPTADDRKDEPAGGPPAAQSES